MSKDVAVWFDGISKADVETLDLLAEDINATVDETVKSVVKGKIIIGKALNSARELIKGDAEFGQWRKEKTNIQSKTEAHYCMTIATKFGTSSKLLKNTSWSALRELTHAPKELIALLEEKAAETGTGPSVSEARAAVTESRPDTSSGTPDRPPAPPVIAAQQKFDVNAIIAHKFDRRTMWFKENMKKVKDWSTNPAEWGYIYLGLDPEPSRPMNPMTLLFVYQGHKAWAQKNNMDMETLKLLKEAHDVIEIDIAKFYNA